MLKEKGYRKKAFGNYDIWCKECFSVKGLTVHHKDGNKENNNLNNLEILCRRCHNEIHGFEKKKIQKYKKIGKRWKK